VDAVGRHRRYRRRDLGAHRFVAVGAEGLVFRSQLSTEICQNFSRIASRLLLLALLAGSSLVGAVEAAQTPLDQKRVLVVYSTRRDSLISEAAERILMQHLDDAFGVRLDYYAEYIDAARFPDEDFSGFSGVIRRKYPDLKPSVVIAVEDAAIGFVSRYREELFAETPVVFFTRDAAKQRLPHSTGIIEPIDFVPTIELVRALQPEVTEVFVVSGGSARDQAYEAGARAQFKRFEPQLTFTYLSGLTVPELERRLGNLPPRSVVYPLLVSQVGGANFKPRDINTRIPRMANRPTYGWHEQHLGDGYVGGSLLQLEPGLTMLAERAMRVLGGEAPDGIEVGHPHAPIARVDSRQLQRWGISHARVPAGFVVEFQDTSIWQRYRRYVIGAAVILMAQSLLIAGLVVQARRRSRAERELRGSQVELTRSYERIRDIGGRLLIAQEAERSRIARELHDDISQQMALLEFDVRDAGGDDKALTRIADISRSVHELSHRLHPASLQLLGLVGSLRSLQQEHLRAGLPVHFIDSDVPKTLPPELTLCLFRVVQETLQNAAKYSEASEVSVELSRSDRHLTLTISDDGVGFDVEKAWGKGLGLISIRERVEASAGTVTVASAPDRGTCFTIRVPI
jgi:signal transduction histidine kinase